MAPKGLIAATAALALMASSAIAAPGRSTAARAAVAVPATESIEEDSELFRRRGFFLPALAILALIIAILVVTKGEDKEEPESP